MATEVGYIFTQCTVTHCLPFDFCSAVSTHLCSGVSTESATVIFVTNILHLLY